MLIFLILIVIAVLIFALKGIIIIRQAEVAIVERLGRYHKTIPSGLHIVWPIIDSLRPVIFGQKYVVRIDLREQVLDFTPQTVITKDNVTMQIDSVIYYQITDSYKAVYEISNLVMAIDKLTITTLRNVIGDLTLDETLVSRSKINSELQKILDEATDKWGVKVNRVELKNINPPDEIQEAMTKQMKAEREKRSVILLAEGDKQSKILKAEGEKEYAIRRAEGEQQSAVLIADGQARAIKTVFEAIHQGKATEDVIAIKYLEALEKMANGNATKIFLPFEATGILSSLGSIKEIFKDEAK
ncbi:TPA: SPFH/Band 7/PHB domain protein [candidate division WOR-3 bacterium]|jgi:regulator of protease activity HflC (stomatin/prohibitin superfamily)|uniref:SPFH/Band 7/PHB domain protein n=1 Tax=candidate division WOR-3 bacterium TaxID=2052148 RepID=A0A350HBT2_UNCW3|nr:SPFH/Band 7/PHB domain protein [candidate division WOR-3 bacterium]